MLKETTSTAYLYFLQHRSNLIFELKPWRFELIHSSNYYHFTANEFKYVCLFYALGLYYCNVTMPCHREGGEHFVV